MVEVVENVIKQVEVIMRGGGNSLDLSTLMKDSHALFNRYYSLISDENMHSLNKDDDPQLLSLAVKLHNKARSLTSQAQTELRAVLKALSGWMLSVHGEQTAKVHCIVIRLLCKAGQELSQLCDNPDAALKCCSSAIRIWNDFGGSLLQKSMSPVELQDIKISLFWTFIEKASILSTKGKRHETIRKAVSGAMEIMQLLPPQIKFSFAEHVSKLGHTAAGSSDSMNDAIYYFKMALNAIESGLIAPELAIEGHQTVKKTTEIMEIRLKAQLALAFAYNETNQCDKAMSCIHAIETSASDNADMVGRMAHSIAYAKHKVALKDRDMTTAEESLRLLLKLPLTPFDTALNAVKRFTEAGEVSVTTEKNNHDDFYKILSTKYPRDPEFSLIRIAHLQSVLAVVTATSDNENTGAHNNALDIAIAIVRDHATGDRPLSQSDFAEVTRIGMSRLRWHRYMGQWDHVIRWCDTLLELHCESEGDTCVNVGLVKVDALLKTRQYERALKLAQALVTEKHSTSTIVTMFQTVLHARKPTSLAVRALLDLQRHNRDEFVSAQADDLSRFTLCCAVVQSATDSDLTRIDRDNTIVQLLREWVKHFVAVRGWRQVTERTEEPGIVAAEDDSDTLFGIVNNLLHLYLRSRLSRRVVHPVQTTATSTEAQSMPMSSKQKATKTEVHSDKLQVRFSLQLESAVITEKSNTDVVLAQEQLNEQCTNNSQIDTVMQLDTEKLPPGALTLQQDTFSQLNVSESNADDMTQPNNIALDTNDIQEEVMEECTQPQVSVVEEEETAQMSDTEIFTVSEELAHLDKQGQPCGNEPIDRQASEPDCVEQDDFFSVFGYPESLTEEAATGLALQLCPQATYLFRGTLTDFNTDLLSQVESLVEVVEAVHKERGEVSALGTDDDLHRLVDMAWNLALLLFTKNKCSFQIASAPDLVKNSTSIAIIEETDVDKIRSTQRVEHRSQALISSARLFEAATGLYSRLSQSIADTSKLQCSCLAYAVAARLDADVGAALSTPRSNNTRSHQFTGKSQLSLPAVLGDTDQDSGLTFNLQQAQKDARKLQELLAEHTCDDSEWERLKTCALMLRFTVTCKLCDSEECQQFVLSQQTEFLRLTAEDILRCAERAKGEAGGSVELTRSLLQLALQVLNRQPRPDYGCMGGIYRQLVELSASRQQALERVEEFEQLADSVQRRIRRGEAVNTFHQSDVDSIVSLAYNFGVTLLELDQAALAEKFLSKAINLLQFASSHLNGWLPKMQDTYALVLKAKADSARHLELLPSDFNVTTCGKKRSLDTMTGSKDVALSMDMMK